MRETNSPEVLSVAEIIKATASSSALCPKTRKPLNHSFAKYPLRYTLYLVITAQQFTHRLIDHPSQDPPSNDEKNRP